MHLTYITIDSVNEGVGQSQILPLIKILKTKGINITLISFEKVHINKEIKAELEFLGIEWVYMKFSNRNSLSPPRNIGKSMDHSFEMKNALGSFMIDSGEMS